MKKILPLSFIELSKKNLIHNIKQFKNLAKKGTKFAVAIKGNAYGHGQNEIIKILNPYVDYFQVDDIEELVLLRKASKKKALVLGYLQKTDLENMIKLRSIISIFSLQELYNLEQTARKLKINQEIHIPVDAYLGREGFLLKDLPKLFTEIKKCRYIRLTGMYAHFANIEDTTDFSHAQKQIYEYQKALTVGRQFGFKNLQTHMSATSGLLAYEKNKGINHLIRLGIGVYGMWPSENLKRAHKKKIILKPILSWKTKVAQIKILPKGSTIGYGLTHTTNKETKIALIPQGYADGVDRKLSNNGFVLIGDTRCQILGRISMNMFTVDVSNLKKIKEEDEVVILGSQGKEEMSAEEMAAMTNTINYEVATKISPLLPRVIF